MMISSSATILLCFSLLLLLRSVRRKQKRRKDGGLTQVEISFLSFSLTTCTCILRATTYMYFSLSF
jgi:hypothetical protein